MRIATSPTAPRNDNGDTRSLLLRRNGATNPYLIIWTYLIIWNCITPERQLQERALKSTQKNVILGLQAFLSYFVYMSERTGKEDGRLAG